MVDLTIELENRPGVLARMGAALGRAGVSIEGGGAWLAGEAGLAHFLFEDGAAARRVLEEVGIRVLGEREVLVQRLNQEEPGQLGKLCQRMADAGVNIETLYSDHNHQLVLVVDEIAKGKVVSEEWTLEQKKREKSAKQHNYNVDIVWTGSDGKGTESYTSYRRDFSLAGSGKPTVLGSSAPAFRGDPSRYNPEELLVASLSACQMLWYLHLCSVHRITIIDYRDNASGTLQENQDGSGVFTEVTLRPRIKISPSSDRNKAIRLHHEAHRFCLIANSVNFPVRIEPEIAS